MTMMKVRVSAEGVSFRQPSQLSAGAVLHPAAKSMAKIGVRHAANFLIGGIPLAKQIDGSFERGPAL